MFLLAIKPVSHHSCLLSQSTHVHLLTYKSNQRLSFAPSLRRKNSSSNSALLISRINEWNQLNLSRHFLPISVCLRFEPLFFCYFVIVTLSPHSPHQHPPRLLHFHAISHSLSAPATYTSWFASHPQDYASVTLLLLSTTTVLVFTCSRSRSPNLSAICLMISQQPQRLATSLVSVCVAFLSSA